MRFLTDQDVYATTVRFLSGLGQDVVTAAQLGLAQAEDAALLQTSCRLRGGEKELMRPGGGLRREGRFVQVPVGAWRFERTLGSGGLTVRGGGHCF